MVPATGEATPIVTFIVSMSANSSPTLIAVPCRLKRHKGHIAVVLLHEIGDAKPDPVGSL